METDEEPTAEDISEAVREAADLVRHAAAFLAGCGGMTRRASIRRMRSCALAIVNYLGAEDLDE